MSVLNLRRRNQVRLGSYSSTSLRCLMLLSPHQDKLESVLDVSHQQMEKYQEQPAHAHKIAYQQRLLQEDLVAIRAQMSRLSTVRLWLRKSV